MESTELTPGQRRTLKARQAFAAKFSSTEEKKRYYQDLARKAAERRRQGLVLSPEEALAIAQAYELLRLAAERVRKGGVG